MATEIVAVIPFNIGGHSSHYGCRAKFSWHPSDPLVVKASFRWSPLEAPADWAFSRELLTEGLTAILNVGKGDVRVRSDAYQYVFTLRGPDGRGQVFLARADIQDFLSATTAAMAPDSEEETQRMDAWMDLALAEILEEDE